MVDTSLFGRLKRLFSTDVIIRNVGGTQLKVLDTVNIQATGVVQTNMYPERYQRIYTGGMGTYVGNAPYSNFTIIRPQLYNDYEVMDGDPIIASVLDIVADESTLKNGAGEILSIKSSDENVQRILYNLFYDVLNIEFNLWGWIRSMCKYGDFYLHMHVAEKYGIYQVIPLNVYNVIREEGLDPKNPAYVRFKVEPNASYMSVTTAGGRNDEYFDNYEIANFRLLGDYNFLPYGRCADFMSRIHTEKGVKELQHIIPGDKVWTYNIEENKYELANVLNVVNSGTKKLFKISTVHNEIKVTDNHPMLVWSFDEEKPVYRQTKDLNKGDYLCLPKKIDFPFQNPKLNKTLSIKETKRNQFLVDSSSLETFPDVVTPDFARFWGFMLGDGWENPSCHTVGFARGINDERNKIYEDLLKKYSGKEKLNELHSKKSNVNPSGVSVNSTVFHDLMTINGYVGKSYSKRFPSWIYECDEETQLSLVKGLMDADGYLFTDKWGCTSYNITLINKEMLKDLKTLLDRIKIKTGKIRPRKFTGKCIVNGEEFNARQSYDFTFYLDGKRKQQYEKYNAINPDYNVELFKIQSIVEELPDTTYDIQVDRNSNFIADGFIIHNSYIEPARKIYKQLCLDGDSKICMNFEGDCKAIRDVIEGEEVLTFNIDKGILETTKVKISSKTGTRIVYELSTSDTSIILTSNHPVLTESGLYKSLEELQIGNKIGIKCGDEVQYKLIESINLVGERDVYDIQVESDNHNFIADGIVVHNCMMEDAMLIHRILRAPQRRVYYIDTGGIPPHEIPAYMEKLKTQTARTPYVDPKSGEYNLRYNMMNVNEDFYIPTRGDKSGTKIDTLPGLEYNAIEDVIYLRDKMLSAVKVPKAFLGYEADVEGKCIDPLTKIPLLDGRTITVAELIEEHNNGIKNYVYSLDTETNNIVPGEIEWAGMTRLNTQTVKVWLDNGEYIRCTSDHKFLTRDGIYKDAQDLKENEALMPLYLRKSDDKKINGYDDKNHKVAKVEWCDDLIDTCDITIKDYHNFGTAAGVIIHNSTLAQQDIRFARTIERIQRIVVSELTKMALVHLYAQGYNDESLTNFELELTTPSIIYEQEKIALMKEKVDLAKNMMDINLFPTDHIYDYLFHMSEDKYDDLRDLMIEDKKRIFRLSQIENEGNDPVLSGESYGTPHDLASLYGKGRNGMGELPSIAYDEKNPVGRPVEKTSVYNTQKRIIGKDPLGKGIDLGPDTPNAPVPKGGSPLALEGTKSVYVQSKKMLSEMKNKLSAFREESLLDESNIKGID